MRTLAELKLGLVLNQKQTSQEGFSREHNKERMSAAEQPGDIIAADNQRLEKRGWLGVAWDAQQKKLVVKRSLIYQTILFNLPMDIGNSQAYWKLLHIKIEERDRGGKRKKGR